MRKKFSIDAKKVLAFEITAPLETIIGSTGHKYIPAWRGRGEVGGEGYFII